MFYAFESNFILFSNIFPKNKPRSKNTVYFHYRCAFIFPLIYSILDSKDHSTTIICKTPIEGKLSDLLVQNNSIQSVNIVGEKST